MFGLVDGDGVGMGSDSMQNCTLTDLLIDVRCHPDGARRAPRRDLTKTVHRMYRCGERLRRRKREYSRPRHQTVSAVVRSPSTSLRAGSRPAVDALRMTSGWEYLLRFDVAAGHAALFQILLVVVFGWKERNGRNDQGCDRLRVTVRLFERVFRGLRLFGLLG